MKSGVPYKDLAAYKSALPKNITRPAPETLLHITDYQQCGQKKNTI